MSYKKIFHCFHGTTQMFYEDIQRDEKFVFEKRDNHWLGNGVYFFLDDQFKANWWAGMAVKKEERRQKKKSSPCVLYIEANVDRDRIFDLNIEEGQQKLNEFILYLKEKGIQITLPIEDTLTEEERENHLRCAVMDLLVEVEKYQASCYLFPNVQKPYMFGELSNYGIINNKGNQICVYDQSILDFSKMKKC